MNLYPLIGLPCRLDLTTSYVRCGKKSCNASTVGFMMSLVIILLVYAFGMPRRSRKSSAVIIRSPVLRNCFNNLYRVLAYLLSRLVNWRSSINVKLFLRWLSRYAPSSLTFTDSVCMSSLRLNRGKRTKSILIIPFTSVKLRDMSFLFMTARRLENSAVV